MNESKLIIVGIGDDGLAGLTEAARRTLAEASVVLGAESTLRTLRGAGLAARFVALDVDMATALEQARAALDDPRPVLVSYGDPLFYGVARYLTDRLGKDRFEVLPHVSSMQLAFARVKESWDDAYLTSLAGRPLEAVVDRIRAAERVGLFASDHIPPRKLARALLEHQIGPFRAYVCEHLGQPDERVTQASLEELAELDFDPLHVLILVRESGVPQRSRASRGRRLVGNPDELFAHDRAKRRHVTGAETRAIALAQLDIRPSSVVWDIGAGSGSVAIEAAQLAHQGVVYAIEPDAENLALLQANAEAFGVPNIRTIAARAPACLADLPDADRIFLGATGRSVEILLRAAFQRLRPGGRLALNVATIEGLAAAQQVLRALTTDVHVWHLCLSRGVEQLDRLRFVAVSPSFLLVAGRNEI